MELIDWVWVNDVINAGVYKELDENRNVNTWNTVYQCCFPLALFVLKVFFCIDRRNARFTCFKEVTTHWCVQKATIIAKLTIYFHTATNTYYVLRLYEKMTIVV